MDYLQITPEKQIPRKEVLEMVKEKTVVLFMFKQDYADTGVILEANLNSNYKECYGTVKIIDSNNNTFITDIANIEFLRDD